MSGDVPFRAVGRGVLAPGSRAQAAGSPSRATDEVVAPVVWRRLSRNLWVARRAGYALGTVERGRLFTALDTNSDVVGRYRTIVAALQEAFVPAVLTLGGLGVGVTGPRAVLQRGPGRHVAG